MDRRSATSKTKPRLYIVLPLILIAASLLCACGKQQEGKGAKASGAETSQWTIDEDSAGNWALSDAMQMPSGLNSTKDFFFRPDSLVYMSREPEAYQLHIYDFSSENRAEHLEKTAALSYPGARDFAFLYLAGMCPDPATADKFWGLWRLDSGEEAGNASPAGHYELVQYDLAGHVLDNVRLENMETGSSAVNINVAKTGDFYYLLMNQELTVLTAGGKAVKTEKVEPGAGIVVVQDTYYLAEAFTCPQRTTLRRLADGALSESIYEIPIPMNQFWTGDDGMLYLSAGDLLYKCNLADQTASLVLRWGDAGLQHTNLRSLAGVSEEFIRVYGYENGRHMLDILQPSDKVDQRIKLTIIGNQYDPQMADWVYGFNQSNDTYRIVIEDPGIVEMTSDELQTRLQLMLTSSPPPDIVDVKFFDNWQELARNGAFADMTPFLEDGSPIRESDYLPNVWACGTVDGKQIFIPYTLSFSLLYGQERYVGSDKGWTLEELLTASKQHEEIPAFAYYSEACLRQLLTFGIEEFVDYSEGTCDFENKLFYDVLECCAKADSWEPDISNDSQGNEAWTPFDSIIREETLLDSVICINRIEDYLAYQCAVPVDSGDSIQLAIKGYPSKDGEPRGLGSMIGSNRLAICGSSAHKEGAWQFIEYVIEETWGDVYSSMGNLPAKTERMREHFLHPENHITFSSYEKAGLELRESTEADVDELMALIASLKFESDEGEPVLQIIEEEAQAYFSGQRSKEAVADIIQSRVGLYLAERHK